MKKNLYIPLTNRAIIEISGVEAVPFLQRLLTNDITKISESCAIYALMLTAQGKFLYDFFIYEYSGKLLLDCAAEKIAEIIAKFEGYKLRSKILISDVSDKYEIIALISSSPQITQPNTIFNDPRSNKLPMRALIKKDCGHDDLKKAGFTEGNLKNYEKLRISLSIPSDIELESSFPLEYEMDKYNAIDYKKGCYIGQEVTARTHYRGAIHKKPRLVRSSADIDLSLYVGQEITSLSSKVGVLRSASENQGIAILREDNMEKYSAYMMVGSITLFLVS